MSKAVALALTALMLAACGQSAEPTAAERLDNAAEQSTPEAANVLENAADALRGQDSALPPSDPNSPVQDAMARAGQAQLGNQSSGQPNPPPQAKPHRPGDPVPPPQLTPTPEAR